MMEVSILQTLIGNQYTVLGDSVNAEIKIEKANQKECSSALSAVWMEADKRINQLEKYTQVESIESTSTPFEGVTVKMNGKSIFIPLSQIVLAHWL